MMMLRGWNSYIGVHNFADKVNKDRDSHPQYLKGISINKGHIFTSDAEESEAAENVNCTFRDP